MSRLTRLIIVNKTKIRYYANGKLGEIKKKKNPFFRPTQDCYFCILLKDFDSNSRQHINLSFV